MIKFRKHCSKPLVLFWIHIRITWENLKRKEGNEGGREEKGRKEGEEK